MELNVAIVGAGRWGKNVVRAFARSERCVVSTLCDTERSCLDAQRTLLPDARFTTQFQDVLLDEAVNAVVLATPARSHAELSLRALAAGKNVFVEKPMALNTEDALAVQRAARSAQRQVMVGHILRYHPAVAELTRLLATGELGEILYASAERSGSAVPGRDASAWWTLAPHDLSILRHLFATDPTAVRAYGHSVDGGVGEDIVTASVCFGPGKVGFLHVGALSPVKTRRLTLVGSERIAVFDDLEAHAKLRIYQSHANRTDWLRCGLSGKAAAGQVHAVAEAEPLLLETQHFVDSILAGTPVCTDDEDGVQVTRALQAGSRSVVARGEVVNVG